MTEHTATPHPRDKFTARMMSNLDGQKDAQIEALVRALRNCRDRLKMDLEEVRHLRRWLSDSELAERADQDEIADEADKQAIAEATRALASVANAREGSSPHSTAHREGE